MIFVTVGTHEQQFNRLVEYMDNWAAEHDEKVIIQTGYSTYEPKYAEWAKLYPYQKIVKLIDEARIVITHGGPSSFIMPLQKGKIPIVVPRQYKFNEHVNDHQLFFVKNVAERIGTVIQVENIDKLNEIIKKYNEIVIDSNHEMSSNNKKFCIELNKIVEELIVYNTKK